MPIADLSDLRFWNNNTIHLSKDCPDVVSFVGRENGLPGDLRLDTPNLTSPQLFENLPSTPLSESKASFAMSLPHLKSFGEALQDRSKSILSPSDSGIGSDDFVSQAEKVEGKASSNRRSTFGKVFQV